jgi:hypothetical protein
MRKENEIVADIEKAKAAYLSAMDKLKEPLAEAQQLSRTVKKLQEEFSATIADGAQPCPKCNQPANGMKVRTETIAKMPVSIYEVGCPGVCKDENGNQLRARAIAQEKAVENWNKGDFFIPIPATKPTRK